MFEWDEVKDRINVEKHGGISLAEAPAMFFGFVVEIRDDRFDYGENRVVAYGEIAGRVHVCVYTQRSEVRRLISFRKANERESNAYRKKRDA